MLREEWIVELRDLAKRIGLAGQPHIANSMRYDADRLEMIVEKTKITQTKDEINGQHSRFN
jgi:hypothetical protein